ncbi:Cyclin PHO80-like [Macleaya cordata]|uniref:Cyclin PHO80-like n=1 Tax=Macleaya cordata TaxID=56857 RepID=A0A200QL51_MACCD|nr:Cyclin PHO80-like [Macleaya cordata]
MLDDGGADESHGRSEPSDAEPSTPRVLTVLSFLLEKLVARNDRLVMDSGEQQKTDNQGLMRLSEGKKLNVFHGVRAPSISIPKYLERIYNYTNCSPSCFVVGHYNNAFFARVGGVSNAELNRLELELLFLLDFGLVVSSRIFESYCLHLEKEMMCGGIGQKIERTVLSNSVDDVTEISVDDTQPSSSPPI